MARSPLPDHSHRTLVVSPFLGSGLLTALADRTTELTVVARPDELDRAYAGIAEDARPHAFDLDPRLVDDSGDQALTELHAKLFVHDLPDGVTIVFVGSANATEAAFTGNSEVLLEMTGPSQQVGVAKFLSDGRDALRSILVPHSWSDPPAAETEAAATMRALQMQLAQSNLTGMVHAGSDDTYLVSYSSDSDLPDLGEASVELRPITLPGWSAQSTGRLALTVTATLAELTRFVGVRIRLCGEQTRFVLAAALEGTPADRHDQLLAHLISDPSRLVRYLLMLLSGGPEDRFDPAVQRMLDSAATGGTDLETLPLMEVMLRALVRSPDRLSSVHRLMAVVRSHPHLADPSLLALWDSVSTLVEQEPR